MNLPVNSIKKYNIIYADPPWSYKNYNYSETRSGTKAKRGIRKEYPTMDIEKIKAFPVDQLADNNCILFLWVTFPLLQEGLDTVRAWGFEFKSVAFIWIKTNKNTSVNQACFFPIDFFDSFMGMGNWTRSNAEIVLLGIKGKLKRQRADIHQLIYEPINKHSKKPDIVREKIVKLCGPLLRIELFARNQTPGWDVFGNQVENSIKIAEERIKNISVRMIV